MQSLPSLPAHEAEGLEGLLNLAFLEDSSRRTDFEDFEAYQIQKTICKKQKAPKEYALSNLIGDLKVFHFYISSFVVCFMLVRTGVCFFLLGNLVYDPAFEELFYIA